DQRLRLRAPGRQRLVGPARRSVPRHVPRRRRDVAHPPQGGGGRDLALPCRVMRKRVSIIGGLSALILVVAAVPAGAGGNGGDDTTPKDFAKSVCTSLSDWGT